MPPGYPAPAESLYQAAFLFANCTVQTMLASALVNSRDNRPCGVEAVDAKARRLALQGTGVVAI